MTPGQEALIEAMRLEQARIYSQTCPEHRQDDNTTEDTTPTVVHLAHERQRRRTA